VLFLFLRIQNKNKKDYKKGRAFLSTLLKSGIYTSKKAAKALFLFSYAEKGKQKEEPLQPSCLYKSQILKKGA